MIKRVVSFIEECYCSILFHFNFFCSRTVDIIILVEALRYFLGDFQKHVFTCSKGGHSLLLQLPLLLFFAFTYFLTIRFLYNLSVFSTFLHMLISCLFHKPI
ncbi:hypothetical protein RchiOBHm_Chr2g0126151 [Rosa chinensis]|uniref:Uncharacterized protein n=1 Tax=Rosa chinensis TaxID=74649 RepID=A0A2P6RTQ4_ROSCH|nr:hypothetical protein RchiOBHm_Chr2g0126151 [Rosa chinensis]